MTMSKAHLTRHINRQDTASESHRSNGGQLHRAILILPLGPQKYQWSPYVSSEQGLTVYSGELTTVTFCIYTKFPCGSKTLAANLVEHVGRSRRLGTNMTLLQHPLLLSLPLKVQTDLRYLAIHFDDHKEQIIMTAPGLPMWIMSLSYAFNFTYSLQIQELVSSWLGLLRFPGDLN